ncbi:MAG TPA: TIGR04282 family arsenosugar biosynthesis glycosyltransferase [Xanthobacteraceae bacterium]|jgi:rSAM/selenodomain-associated transferase 1|nr:TIGR04282 family arsenosugar biosynthesis glycosyltransferase [Xanthobacteraceae bacterium]
MNETIAIAVLAKAPLPGFAKTRLIPALGAEGAALLQARLVEHSVATACAARIGPVALWGAPDESHPLFQTIGARLGVALARQGGGDLGERMLSAVAAADMPVLVIGTDCPALTADHLRMAADILRSGADAAIIPAEDGGYALIGLRAPAPTLFSQMHWSVPSVMEETRRRLRDLGMTWQEPVTLWDLDLPEDIERLRQIGLHHLIPSANA